LHDHRCIGFVGRFHDGAHLFEVIHIEGRDALILVGGVIE